MDFDSEFLVCDFVDCPHVGICSKYGICLLHNGNKKNLIMYEITVYRSPDDYKNGKPLLRAPINCPDTFDFLACVNMFKNLYPKCYIMFSA